MRLLSKNPDTGEISIVNNSQSLLFGNAAELLTYYPTLDLSQKTKISYEVDRFNVAIHIDSAGNVYEWIENPTSQQRDAVRNSDYETLIDAVPSLHSSVNDPYTGVDLATSKTIRIRELKDEAKDVIDEKYDWTDLLPDPANPGAQLSADIAAVKSAFINARNLVNAAGTVSEVKAVTANWPTL